MSKVNFDSTMLNNCSKSLNSALQGFDTAINAANGLDVPEFAYQGWLNNLSGKLGEYKAQCKDDQFWAETTNAKIIDDLNTSENDINAVEVQTGLVKEYNVN